jgi:predicted AAA+ superfamily ATPase
MPHLRSRYLVESIKKAMTSAPIVGLMGQRQVGKTTLASLLGREYVTLDIRNNLEVCENDPELFLKNRKHPFVIDESQMSPALFPALKEAVRLLPKPGQYIITGSVRFSSRKQIRESLTGRISVLELLPMSITETHGEPLNALPLIAMAGAKTLQRFLPTLARERRPEVWQKRIDTHIKLGGLPGVCFARDQNIRNQKLESYLETILLRDLQLIVQTTLAYSNLKNLVAQIALKQSEPVDFSELARQTGISTITVKKLLAALQGLYLIREIPGLGDIKKSCFYLEDSGLAQHLMSGWQNPRQDLFRLLHANLRQQFYGRLELGMATQVFHYQTRGGASVPLVFRTPKGTIAYSGILERQVTSSVLLSAKSFLKKFPQSIVFIAHQGAEIRQWDAHIWGVPLRLVL